MKQGVKEETSFRVIDGSLSSCEFGVGTSVSKKKGRVALRGDIVKDDSEQGSSASQMTAARVIQTSRMFRSSS